MESRDMATAFELQQVRRNWGWFLALGVALTVLGLVCLSSTVFATLLTTVALGILTLIGGVALIASAFWAENGWGMVLRIALGALFLLGGWYLLTRPVIGALTLTAIMGWFFVLSGAVRLITAFVERMRGWGWTALNGGVTLLLGVLLLANWPVSGLFAIGLFLGIDLLLNGILWMSAGFGARLATPPATPPASALT